VHKADPPQDEARRASRISPPSVGEW